MRLQITTVTVLWLAILCTASSLAEPIKLPPSNPCANKPHGTRGYSIPQNGSEITRATHAHGVINCLAAEPATGSCHIEVAASGLKMNLHAKDNMSLGEKDDTFTFTCGLGATHCVITHCD
jgi:hypothetical protein